MRRFLIGFSGAQRTKMVEKYLSPDARTDDLDDLTDELADASSAMVRVRKLRAKGLSRVVRDAIFHKRVG